MLKVLRAITLLLVAAPVLAYGWAFGGLNAPVLAKVMPWGLLTCAVALLVLPQQHRGEGWWRTEKRVLRGILHDPFFWIALATIGLLVIPLFNVSLCPWCDWEAIDAGADPRPPCRFLPFCCNVREHTGVLWWWGPCLLVALCVRHALIRAGRRSFYELLVWNSTFLAFFGFVQLLGGAKFPYWEKVDGVTHFFSTFAYPNVGGSFFVFSYALALGLWSHRMCEVDADSMETHGFKHPFIRAYYPIIAVLTCLAATLATLSRAAMLLAVFLTVSFFIYIFLRALAGQGWWRARSFRSAITASAMMLMVFLAVFIYAPPEVGRELSTINSRGVASRMTGKNERHTTIASAIMRDFPFFGVGGWGYRHFYRSYLTDREQADFDRYVQPGCANVHNDYMQILAEHGLVGFLLLFACMWMLVSPTLKAWRDGARNIMAAERSGLSSAPLVLFMVDPPVFWSFLACVAVLLHAFGDCPLRSGAVLSLLVVTMPIATGFLPPPFANKR